MSIDTTAPRTRRAVIAGAFGALLGSIGTSARPQVVLAGTDGDVVLDATNTAAGTTAIVGASSDPVLRIAAGSGVAIAGEGSGVGVLGASGVAWADVPDPIAASTGVYGVSAAGHAIYGASDSGVGVYAANNSSTVAAIVAEGDPGTAIHGHANAGPVPTSPSLTGVYGSATGDGHGVHGSATSGRAVHGAATTGVGVRAVATTGLALEVAGRVQFSRSGRASVPANKKSVDVTVPGGLSGSANVLATLQIKRGGIHVLAARPNYPAAGQVRIYISDVASTTASTPLAWFVLG
jgi:hypothetical protein